MNIIFTFRTILLFILISYCLSYPESSGLSLSKIAPTIHVQSNPIETLKKSLTDHPYIAIGSCFSVRALAGYCYQRYYKLKHVNALTDCNGTTSSMAQQPLPVNQANFIPIQHAHTKDSSSHSETSTSSTTLKSIKKNTSSEFGANPQQVFTSKNSKNSSPIVPTSHPKPANASTDCKNTTSSITQEAQTKSSVPFPKDHARTTPTQQNHTKNPSPLNSNQSSVTSTATATSTMQPTTPPPVQTITLNQTSKTNTISSETSLTTTSTFAPLIYSNRHDEDSKKDSGNQKKTSHSIDPDNPRSLLRYDSLATHQDKCLWAFSLNQYIELIESTKISSNQKTPPDYHSTPFLQGLTSKQQDIVHTIFSTVIAQKITKRSEEDNQAFIELVRYIFYALPQITQYNTLEHKSYTIEKAQIDDELVFELALDANLIKDYLTQLKNSNVNKEK
ncbi:MAG: hypothetical protein WBQ73_01540 [Candidatus Babeliales bacterium]